MASLLKKLFDTMPLAGVEGALPGKSNEATIAQMARFVGFHRRPPKRTVTARHPSERFLRALEGGGRLDGMWELVEIWGYDAWGDPARVRRVTCRVRDDQFKNYVVLDDLEWGYAPIANPSSFRPAVLVVFKGKPLELPLTNEYHLMSFTTWHGKNQEEVHPLWPLQAEHDRSLLHVFAYDLHRASTAIIPLASPSHPQKDEVEAMLRRCERLNIDANTVDEEKAHEVLFKDDLWDTSNSKAPPAATVPEDVDLSLNSIRILVACSLTPCRERDDFQPGRPMGVGRLYPHIMVVATAPLDRVDAGVRLTRPRQTTVLEGEHCGCGEMLPDIHGLLVADSNSDAMVLHNVRVVTAAPHIYWANLFNYYVTDPATDPNLQGKLIQLVKREKTMSRNYRGAVTRDCSDILYPSEGATPGPINNRVTKFPRQGAFDNLHLSPQMTVKDTFDRVIVSKSGGHDVIAWFTNYAAWKMDVVTMAPFCPHDCFHIHWRWTDNVNDHWPTFGWGPQEPYDEVGEPMVPRNQDVFLLVPKNNSVTYLAQAHDVPMDRWQPFFHHGAGYGLSSLSPVKLGMFSAPKLDGMRFVSGGVTVTGNFALFYWRLRYRLKPVQKKDAAGQAYWDVEVEERFQFTDEAKALDM